MQYKTAYVSGDNSNILPVLRDTIEGINKMKGKIIQMVQSQSTNAGGWTIVTITILYTVE